MRFVLEQHLGHQTYAENLRSAAERRRDVDATWVPVTYDASAWPVPSQVRDRLGGLAGRAEVRRGLDGPPADVDVYNTQVPAALAGRRLRRPYVLVTDVTPMQYDRVAAGYGHQVDRNGPVAAWKRSVNRRIMRDAAFCVGWSSWVTTSFVDDYGVPPDRTAVIAPGVDLERWSPGPERADDSVRLLFVGGDLRRKGGDVLLDVVESLPDGVELTLVTKAAVTPTERVRVVNDLQPNDDRLIELFRSSDVFVLPTTAETFGIAAVEASAAGLPVVATRIGGLTDIVHDGVSGRLLEPGDAAGLAHVLGELVADADARRRYGAAARRRAERLFDAETNANALVDLARSAADPG